MKLLSKLSAKYIAAAVLTLPLVSAAGPMSQQQALDHILANNPTLRNMTRSADAAVISARGAGQLAGAEVEGEYMFGSGAADKWSAGVSQSFDLPEAYKARRRAANAAADAVRGDIAIARRQTATEARLLFVDGVYNTRRIATLQLLKQNLDSVARSIEYGYDKGELTILDLKKIRLELFKLDNEISLCRQELDGVNASLCLLAGDSTLRTDFSDYQLLPLLSREQYIAYAQQIPQVAAARSQADALVLDARASEFSRRPTFSLGYRHAYEDHHHFNGLTASIGLPSWGHNYDADYKRALAENAIEQSRTEVDAAVLSVCSDYDRAVQLRQTLAAMTKVVIDDEYVELMMLAYRGGQINVITMIQEINFYIEASLDYQSTDRDYRRLLARLDSYTQP